MKYIHVAPLGRNWFGLRNRAHGFDSLWSKPATGHWPEAVGMQERGKLFYWRGHYPVFGWCQFHISFGWAVYASTRYSTGYEYRPYLLTDL